MTEHVQHVPVEDVAYGEMGEVPQEEQTPQDLEAVVQDLSVIQQRCAVTEAALIEMVGEDTLNSLIDAAQAALGEDEEIVTANVHAAAMRILPDHFTDEQMPDISPKIDDYFIGMQEYNDMSAEAASLGRVETEHVMEELTQQVDWDAFFTRTFDGEVDYHEAGGFLRRIGNGGQSDLGSIESVRELKKWQARLAKEGLIRDAEDIPDNEAVNRQQEWLSGDLEQGLVAWADATRQSMGFLDYTARDDGRLDFVHRAMGVFNNKKPNIDNVIRALGETSRSPVENKTPPPIIEACKRQIARLMEEFDEAEQEFMTRELDETIPFVQGSKLFEEATGVDRASDWVQKKMESFPRWYRRGLGFIGFVDPTTDALGLEQDGPNGRFVTGYREPEKNKINVNTQRINEDFRENFPNAANELALKKISATFSHELAHHAHARTLPVSWLRSWVTMCARNPIVINEYVEHSAQDPTLSQDQEMLATCLQKYDTDPGSLMAEGAFEHMRRMNGLLGKYNPDYVEQIISTVQKHPKLPTTDEGVKYDVARELTLDFNKIVVT